MKSRSFAIATCLLIVAALACAGKGKREPTPGYDWPHWRGPDGNGISQETQWNPQALSKGARALWKADVGMGNSNVVTRGNRLYTASMGAVQCLNAQTGRKLWKYVVEGFDVPQSTPTVEGASLYFLTNAGVLLCLDAQSGRLRWQKDLVSEYGVVLPYYKFAGSPIVEGDLVLVTANTSGIALNRETGALVWKSEKPPAEFPVFWVGQTSGTDYSTPVVFEREAKRRAIFSSWNGISSVEIESGKPVWLYHYELYSGNEVADPVVSGDKIYIADEYSKDRKRQSVLLKIAGEGQSILWKSPALWTDISSPLIINGYVYGCHGGPDAGFANLCCLDLETGRCMWEKHLGGGVGSESISLTAAADKLIVLNDRGTLFIVDASPASYAEISRCDVLKAGVGIMRFWTPPVLSHGKLYCRNYGGDLVCIDVSK